MKTIVLFLYFFAISFCAFAQIDNKNSDSEVDLSDFGTDSLYMEQLKLKEKQGKLSDCEFGIKIANADFKKEHYFYHSKELVGTCLYCEILLHDYNVKWLFTNDLFSEEYYCSYNREMSRLLNTKYGFDIFKRALEKANDLIKTESSPVSKQ